MVEQIYTEVLGDRDACVSRVFSGGIDMFTQTMRYKSMQEPKQKTTNLGTVKSLPLRIELAMFDAQLEKKQIWQNARRRGWLKPKSTRSFWAA